MEGNRFKRSHRFNWRGDSQTSIAQYWNGDIPWLSVADFNTGRKYVYDVEKSITQLGLEKSSTKLLQEGDIIISARGTVGVVAMLGCKMAFNQSCYGVRAKEEKSRNYVCYLLKNVVNDLQQISHGGVFDTITRDTFKEIKVILPTETEILRFEQSVSPYFKEMFLNKSQIRTIEKLRDALLPKLMSGEVRVQLAQGEAAI